MAWPWFFQNKLQHGKTYEEAGVVVLRNYCHDKDNEAAIHVENSAHENTAGEDKGWDRLARNGAMGYS